MICVGIDRSTKIWNLHVPGTAQSIWDRTGNDTGKFDCGDQLPISEMKHKYVINALDASWQPNSNSYAVGGSCVQLWDINRYACVF